MRDGMWVIAERRRYFGEERGDWEVREIITAESGFTRHVGWFRERADAERVVSSVNSKEV
jgi:hypothetical protein